MNDLMWDYQEKISYSREKATKVELSETEQSRASLWCLLPGQKIVPHVHAGDHIWVVFEGEGNFLSEESAAQAISPGSVLVAPAGSSHGVENTGEEGLVFLSVSAGS
jgi:quercetin dioxygenase-like cupin family protein